MTVQDFEHAIEALNCGIDIDEIIIRKGQVHRVYGHKDCQLLQWDDHGRGYAYGEFPADSGYPEEPGYEVYYLPLFVRAKAFDLIFN